MFADPFSPGSPSLLFTVGRETPNAMNSTLVPKSPGMMGPFTPSWFRRWRAWVVMNNRLTTLSQRRSLETRMTPVIWLR